MRPESGFQMPAIWPYTGKKTKTSQFVGMTSLSCFWRCSVFLVKLVSGTSFMSVLLLALKLQQFSFIQDWREIRKSEILPFEFSLISGDWGELGIPNLAHMSLIKRYWMLENSRDTSFTMVDNGKPMTMSEQWKDRKGRRNGCLLFPLFMLMA